MIACNIKWVTPLARTLALFPVSIYYHLLLCIVSQHIFSNPSLAQFNPHKRKT